MRLILTAAASLLTTLAWAESPLPAETACDYAAAGIAADVRQAQLAQRDRRGRTARACQLTVTVNSTGAIDAVKFGDCDALGRAEALRVLAQAHPLPPPAACERPEFNLTLPAE